MIHVTVNRAIASDEGDYLQVAFGEAANGSDFYVILQLEKEPLREDHDLGMTGIYIEIRGQEHSGYNVIHQVEIKRNIVSIVFDAAALDLSPENSPLEIVCANEPHLASEVADMIATMGRMSGTPVKMSVL